MTRAAKILARNPRLKKQMDDAMKWPAYDHLERTIFGKPKRKQAGRSPSSAEKAAPAILDWLVGRGEIVGWMDNNAVDEDQKIVLKGASGTKGHAEACDYTFDFQGWLSFSSKGIPDWCVIEVKHEGHLKTPEARVGRVKFKLFQCIPPHTELLFIWCELKPWGWLVKFWMGGRLERKEKVTFETLMRKGK